MTPRFSNSGRRLARLKSLGALALALGTAAACENFLTANNPGAVEAEDLNDAAYASLIGNGPVFAFQDSWDDITWWNGQLTDEIINRNGPNPFIEEGQIDRRELYSDMTYIPAFIYSPHQRARFLAEDAVRRLTVILGDTVGRDLRVARALAYGGYTYIGLGEMMCTTPIDRSVPKTWDEMMTAAVAKFDSAVVIANAAKAYYGTLTPAVPNAILAADSVINFARVGAARASLDKNDKTAATTYAQLVPAGFVFNAYYSENTTGQMHRTYNRIGTGNGVGTLGGTPFEAMAADPRVPRATSPSGRAGTPLSPPSYSTFNNTVVGANFAPTMAVRVASGLEARYIIAEAAGSTAATLTFVNERRAAGLQTPVALTGDALMAELRDQKSRDFYLDNHRLGDLRRYKKYSNVDLFPKGPYPGSTTGQIYNESVDCWPLPTNEINDNPNVPRG
jgi:starch-binding outer membrane protein, SusD/RagB family